MYNINKIKNNMKRVILFSNANDDYNKEKRLKQELIFWKLKYNKKNLMKISLKKLGIKLCSFEEEKKKFLSYRKFLKILYNLIIFYLFTLYLHYDYYFIFSLFCYFYFVSYFYII